MKVNLTTTMAQDLESFFLFQLDKEANQYYQKQHVHRLAWFAQPLKMF